MKRIKDIAIAVDILIFTKDLKILLIKRRKEPFKGKFALPGGFLNRDETLENAAKRELLEETGLKIRNVRLLNVFDNIKRDPRGRVISVTFYSFLENKGVKLKASKESSSVKFFSLKSLPELAFDHNKVIKYALKKVKDGFNFNKQRI